MSDEELSSSHGEEGNEEEGDCQHHDSRLLCCGFPSIKGVPKRFSEVQDAVSAPGPFRETEPSGAPCCRAVTARSR